MCPKEEIVFLFQVIVLYTVILINIYNLTTGHENSNLWTALLSCSLDYLLPNLTLRRKASDFYLTLPSSASMTMYPDNTLAHYITDLPHLIDLSGEWEYRLTDIQYSHTWYNVGADDSWFSLNETVALGQTPSARIAAGYYKGPVTLMIHVNKGMERMGTDKVKAEFSYSSIAQKITLLMTPGTEFTMPHHSALGTMLGFDPSVVSSRHTQVRPPEHRWKGYRSHTVGQRGFAA